MVKYRIAPIYSTHFPERQDVLFTDVIRLRKNQMIKITPLKINSVYQQGISVCVQSPKGRIEFEGEKARGFYIWFLLNEPNEEIETPREFLMKFVSSEEEANIGIWNAYKRPDGKFYHHMNKSGMILEQKDGKRTYHCNDVGEPATFDKLVFSIEIV